MTDTLSDGDLRRLAAAVQEAMRNQAGTAHQVKGSVRHILETGGSIGLANKIDKIPPETWASFWSGIKEFFSAIWDGIAGAAEKLVDTIFDLFQ